MVVQEASQANTVRSVAELRQLSLSELEMLWDNVPTEYQDRIKRRYTQVVKAKGVKDDAGELDTIKSYLERYENDGLIPAGDKWLKISPTARKDFLLDASEAQTESEGEQRSRLPIMLIAALLVIAVALILMVSRLLSGTTSREIVAHAGTPTQTATMTLTPTPTIIPTETPLALMDADSFVDDSDNRANQNFYPVVFRIVSPDGSPRVFVVQERLIETTEWRYDSNPDVASWLSGMFVNPVFGIPFSQDNLRLFESMDAGTRFVLRMNTGAELVFRFDAIRQIPRDDTSIFSQLTPGITVVLIGQTGTDGLPTPQRLVALGTYTPTQELDDLAQNIGLPVPQGTSATIDNLSITVAGTDMQSDSNSSSDLRIVVQLEARSEAVNLENFQWRLEDDNGLQYTARSFAFAPDNLDVGTNRNSSLIFRVPSTFSSGYLVVTAERGQSMRYVLDISLPEKLLTTDALDVQIRTIERDDRYIYLAARVYNPTASTLYLSEADVWFISGYVPDPPGPMRHPLDFAPLTLEPNQAWDTEWHFDWNGSDPFAAIGIAGRHYTVTLLEN